MTHWAFFIAEMSHIYLNLHNRSMIDTRCRQVTQLGGHYEDQYQWR